MQKDLWEAAWYLQGLSPVAQQERIHPQAGDTGGLGEEDALEKEMATHCSIPAWRTPWTGAWLAAGSTLLDTFTQ